VFVSSHLMSEMESTADHLIVIGRGSLLADCTMEEFIARSSGQTVRVRTPQPDVLAKAVSETVATTGAAATRAGGAAGTTATATNNADGSLTVHGLTSDQVGDLAFEHGVRLHELTVVRASLEEAFMELTADSVEYRAGQGPGKEPGPGDQLAADGTASGQPAVEDSYSVEGRI
jgi:ABC-2 type transport system ATP-binding protein